MIKHILSDQDWAGVSCPGSHHGERRATCIPGGGACKKKLYSLRRCPLRPCWFQWEENNSLRLQFCTCK